MGGARPQRSERRAPFFSPEKWGPSCVWMRARWRALLWRVYVAALLLCNMWLAYAAGELVDLYISSVELWAELARKHLELTL